ncbi:hypothetical protein HAX54_046809 [Datura stramonium]|uniref:tRNA pseudouridine synthase n=1 Tax=Datura stramonium TaxID=4076 RepID=A0ABS8WJU8_DATST|nr:hypothetical protein [Datura stramonium]
MTQRWEDVETFPLCLLGTPFRPSPHFEIWRHFCSTYLSQPSFLLLLQVQALFLDLPSAHLSPSGHQLYGNILLRLLSHFSPCIKSTIQPAEPALSAESIEGELEKAISKAGGIRDSNFGNLYKIGWARSSRTDKGVHSLATMISLKMEIPRDAWEDDPSGIILANCVNSNLPENIRVFSILPSKKLDSVSYF